MIYESSLNPVYVVVAVIVVVVVVTPFMKFLLKDIRDTVGV